MEDKPTVKIAVINPIFTESTPDSTEVRVLRLESIHPSGDESTDQEDEENTNEKNRDENKFQRIRRKRVKKISSSDLPKDGHRVRKVVTSQPQNLDNETRESTYVTDCIKFKSCQKRYGDNWRKLHELRIKSCSCYYCMEGIFYHYGKAFSDDGSDCSSYACACCDEPDCPKRWACFGILWICIPCLCFYWPGRCVMGTVSLCCE